jgi:hypothetical protein
MAILASLALAAPAVAQSPTCTGDLGSLPSPKAGAPPLTFGIYPGGLAGQVVGPPADPKPDDPAKILAALGQLRGGSRPFVLHLYLEWNGTGDRERRVREAETLIDRYASRGYAVEYVLTYRPRARRGEPDVREFVAFTRAMVRRLGPRLKSLQVMNEVNNGLSPDASDGAYPGARDALPRAVIAAADEKRRIGLSRLEIGLNWFYRLSPDYEYEFWSELGRKGGPALARSVDWVGLDAYPGTFFPPGSRYRESMANAMSALRECYMPLAGLGPRVPIHVSENGYPTGPGRSYEEQVRAMTAMVRTVHDFRANYGVTDYRWFDLRDGDTASPSFQQQYGIMRDDYTPKPAFATYRNLIAELGARPGCRDLTPPRASLGVARVRNRRLIARGTARDGRCPSGVARVYLAVARTAGRGRCRFVTARGRLTRARRCRRPVLIEGFGREAWLGGVKLPRRGRYRVTARAVDRVGLKGRPSRVRVVRLR